MHWVAQQILTECNQILTDKVEIGIESFSFLHFVVGRNIAHFTVILIEIIFLLLNINIGRIS